MRPGQVVTYLDEATCLHRRVEAIVRHSFEDGRVTVEAQNEIDEDGEPAGPYLGYTVTIDAAELSQ